MNTLQVHDVFEPYYAGRNPFFDHSEQAGKARDLPREAKDANQRKEPEEKPGPDRRCA